jgi:RNA polymerase sigma-70 factor (family 1)
MDQSRNNQIDRDFWNKVRQGNVPAFSFLFNKYYQSLYQFAGRFVKDAQSAEDLVQDVFVRLWTNRKELQITSSLKSYLHVSVKNQALNYIRREKKLQFSEDYTDDRIQFVTTPEDQVIEKEMITTVHEAIEKLPKQCRVIYLMKRYDGLNYQEIAGILNISVNTVKTQLKRALKTLLTRLTYLKTCML